jgi:hypothetical protein
MNMPMQVPRTAPTTIRGFLGEYEEEGTGGGGGGVWFEFCDARTRGLGEGWDER